MTAEEQQPTTSEGAEEPAGEEQEETAAPTLNREQRRALAKGKKGPTGASNPSVPHPNNQRGPASRDGGFQRSNIPRTGHK